MSQNPTTNQLPDWDLYRALREQWTHEDNLVNHRLMWLILSEGLLFTAYGTLSTAKLHLAGLRLSVLWHGSGRHHRGQHLRGTGSD